MNSENTGLMKKWFIISFKSESHTINERSSTFAVFCTEDKILDPLSLDPSELPRIDEWTRLNAIYKGLDGYAKNANVTEDALRDGIKEALSVAELTADGQKISRDDLIDLIYTESVIQQFLREVKA